MERMYRLAVSNQKGGVGKTTDAINLAGALAARGHDVLAADLDPQGWLTIRLGLQTAYEAEPPNLHTALEEPQQHDPRDLVVEHAEFDVLPANVDMFALEQDLIASGWQPRQRLQMLLDQFDEDAYDFLVVDAPPSLGPINDSVIIATERLIIPVRADRLSQLAIDHLMNQIETLEERYQMHVAIAGVFVSDVTYPLDNAQEAAIEWFDDTFAGCPIEIVRSRVAIERSLDRGGSIFGEDADETDMTGPFLAMADHLESDAGEDR